jgi:hypothetical protein
MLCILKFELIFILIEIENKLFYVENILCIIYSNVQQIFILNSTYILNYYNEA